MREPILSTQKGGSLENIFYFSHISVNGTFGLSQFLTAFLNLQVSVIYEYWGEKGNAGAS